MRKMNYYSTPNPTDDVVRRLPSNIQSGGKRTTSQLPFLPSLDDTPDIIESSSPQRPMTKSSECTPLPRNFILSFKPRAPTIYLKPRTSTATTEKTTNMSIQSSSDMKKVTKLASDLTMSSPFSDEKSSCIYGNLLLRTPVLSLQVRPVTWNCKAEKLKINSPGKPSPPRVLIRPRQMADTRRQLQPRRLAGVSFVM